MRRPVSFDNQAMTEADEIKDITADRNLTSELHAFKTPVAQKLPQRPLIGHGFPPHCARKP